MTARCIYHQVTYEAGRGLSSRGMTPSRNVEAMQNDFKGYKLQPVRNIGSVGNDLAFKTTSQSMYYCNNLNSNFTDTYSNVFYKPREMMYEDTSIGSLIKQRERQQKLE
jgi:hypothetical protein